MIQFWGAVTCTTITAIVVLGVLHLTWPGIAFLGVYAIWQIIWVFPQVLGFIAEVLGDIF